MATPGRPLDHGTRADLEPRFGHDFGRVRIHTDAPAAASARAVSARAYTVGEHVVFGSGQYAPGTAPGRALLGHELAHVVTRPDGQARTSGVSVTSPDGPVERVAERVAHAALHGHVERRPALDVAPPPAVGGVLVQRACEFAEPGTVDHDESEGRARRVAVRLRGDKHAKELKGRGASVERNAPTAEPLGWKQLDDDGHVARSHQPHSTRYYAVKAHLWNGILSGPGDKEWNLTPLPQGTNLRMSVYAEEPMKRAFKAGQIVSLETVLSYYSNDVKTLTNYEAFVPKNITVTWSSVNPDNSVAQSKQVWSENVTQPVGALDDARRKNIAELQEKGAVAVLGAIHSNAAELVNLDEVRKTQYRNVVLGAITKPEIKMEIVRNYPETVLSLGERARVELLRSLPWEVDLVVKGILRARYSPAVVYDEIVTPLRIEPILARRAFDQLEREGQSSAVLRAARYSRTLIRVLGESGKKIIVEDPTGLFVRQRPSVQAGLIDECINEPRKYRKIDELLDDAKNHAFDILTTYARERTGSRFWPTLIKYIQSTVALSADRKKSFTTSAEKMDVMRRRPESLDSSVSSDSSVRSTSDSPYDWHLDDPYLSSLPAGDEFPLPGSGITLFDQDELSKIHSFPSNFSYLSTINSYWEHQQQAPRQSEGRADVIEVAEEGSPDFHHWGDDMEYYLEHLKKKWNPGPS